MVNWPEAIERNRDALLRIVEVLFALAGLAEGGSAETLPRHLRNHVLRILRPAESAVRRLVIVAALSLPAICPSNSGSSGARQRRAGGEELTGGTKMYFPLIDPLKRFDLAPRRRYAKTFPRITCIGLSEPTPIPGDRIPSPDDPVGAERLCRRLTALKHALDDLDGQAKRLARWKARRDTGRLRAPRCSPMRPGWPPGHRRRPFHAVDTILRECHALARAAWDTS